LSIVGTSIGPALAISMQANPPAAAAAANPADIFKASRRLKFGMVLVPEFGLVTAALGRSFEIQGRLTGVSTEMPPAE
jgi:hypothetical protein